MFAADLQNDTRSTVTQVDTRGAGTLYFSNVSEEYIVLATPMLDTMPYDSAYDGSLSDEDLLDLFDINFDDESTEADLNGTNSGIKRLGKDTRRRWRKRFTRAVQRAVSAVVSVAQVFELFWLAEKTI